MTVRIIRSHATAHSTAEVFNFVDVQQQCDQIVASAQRKANEILEAARTEAHQLREQTRLNALDAGRSEGLREAQQMIALQAGQLAEQRITDQLMTALPALHRAAELLQAERDRWFIRWEQTAVRLGVAIAEKLIQRQLTVRPEIANEMMTDALRLAAGQTQLTVYLHPDDLAVWGDRAAQIIQSLTACGDTTLVPDNQMMRGGCRIETGHGEIDARVETMLHRIADELLEE